MIRNRVVAFSILSITSVVFLSGCGITRIEPGHVGIKVNLAGSDRGVSDLTITTGWVFYNPFTQQVFEWPTFVQTAQYTKEEQVSFNSSEGMNVTADLSLSYQLVGAKIPAFYVQFRTDDLETFTHGFLHNVIRDVCNETGGKFGIEEIYGPKKDIYLAEVRKRLEKELSEFGVVIVQLGFIGAPRIPDNVRDQLNAKVQATQTAMTAENNVRTAKANADISVAQAEGAKRAAIASAEGEKQSSILRAEGQAEANRRVAASITGLLLDWQRLQVAMRWDGVLPTTQITGGSGTGMFLQLPVPPAAAKAERKR